MREADEGPIGSPAQPADDDRDPRVTGNDIRLARTISLRPGAAQLPPVATAAIPTTVGDYTIVRRLGEGGSGVVYEAEQRSPHRRVALKVMRQGHQVDELHTRMFRHEAEALGRLRHPNIAAVFESGHTADGHDFFAMELVHGVTVAEWLRHRGAALSSDELRLRLGLFRTLCEAVHYAHQRGVIHRDLKPTNIMVTEESSSIATTGSARPTVKILDFGLARITDVDVRAATLVSELGQIKGTLHYMSPEQARGEVESIDVRTDVYALGVTLYEMLTLHLPYELQRASIVEAVRVICEVPPRPLRENWSGVSPPDADIETIVRKALAKDPEQRYASALALAEDIERYLTSQPITARPPSAAYRARKFIRRHRFGVAASALMLLALLLGMAGTTAGLVRARRAHTAALAEAATSERVSRFLAEMLGSVDPAEVGAAFMDDLAGRVGKAAMRVGTPPEQVDRTVAAFREAVRDLSPTDAGRMLVDGAILAKAGAAIQAQFATEPVLAGRLEHTLGETYERLGLYPQAVTHAGRAVELRRAALGPRAADTLQSQALLGTIEYRLANTESAESILRATLAEQRRSLGAEHPDTLLTELRLSWVVRQAGRYAEAERLLEEVVDLYRKILGPEHVDTVNAMNSLAVVISDQERYEEAAAIHREVLAVRSGALGPTHGETLKSMTNLAVNYFYLDRTIDATELFSEVYERQRSALGPEHPTTLASANNLAAVYERTGRLDEAEELQKTVLDAKRRVLGPTHPETLSSMHNLALINTARGHLDEAESLHGQVFEARGVELGRQHPKTLESLCALAGVAALRGDRALALDRLREAVRLGYARADNLAADSDFTSLADDPEFLQVIDAARGNSRVSPSP